MLHRSHRLPSTVDPQRRARFQSCQHADRRLQGGLERWPLRHKSPARTAPIDSTLRERTERILLHPRVLVAEVLFDYWRTLAHPLFIAARCVRDIQENDSELLRLTIQSTVPSARGAIP